MASPHKNLKDEKTKMKKLGEMTWIQDVQGALSDVEKMNSFVENYCYMSGCNNAMDYATAIAAGYATLAQKMKQAGHKLDHDKKMLVQEGLSDYIADAKDAMDTVEKVKSFVDNYCYMSGCNSPMDYGMALAGAYATLAQQTKALGTEIAQTNQSMGDLSSMMSMYCMVNDCDMASLAISFTSMVTGMAQRLNLSEASTSDAKDWLSAEIQGLFEIAEAACEISGQCDLSGMKADVKKVADEVEHHYQETMKIVGHMKTLLGSPEELAQLEGGFPALSMSEVTMQKKVDNKKKMKAHHAKKEAELAQHMAANKGKKIKAHHAKKDAEISF